MTRLSKYECDEAQTTASTPAKKLRGKGKPKYYTNLGNHTQNKTDTDGFPRTTEKGQYYARTDRAGVYNHWIVAVDDEGRLFDPFDKDRGSYTFAQTTEKIFLWYIQYLAKGKKCYLDVARSERGDR